MSEETHESVGVDELDLSLVNALQIYPRAPWSLLGPVLGTDPATLTRRWARLKAAGCAWVTTTATQAYVARSCTALVEIDCAPGHAMRVANIIARDPHTIMIDRLASGRDLLVVVFTTDLPSMERYVTDRLGALHGVQRTTNRIMTGFFAEAGRWRLDALDPDQHSRIQAAYHRPTQTSGELHPNDYELLRLLHLDGRASYAELAPQLGISPSTARRRLDHLEATGYLSWQCDFARPLAGWPITAAYWASAPTGLLAETARSLAQLPETRFCVTVAGPHNIILGVYLHSIADTDRFETEIGRQQPHLSITDRAIAYHTVKAYSRVLDPRGRCIETITPAPGISNS
ncbi:Lrp/AsnC family transcriptional regulator [Nocardia sp. CA-128927]|uniref:Lrp/AsnC family transcriptional regulator n=1 Tax=Nocardia sp. CA-128927 TaxID=3239975 RepID=UPI003D95BB22